MQNVQYKIRREKRVVWGCAESCPSLVIVNFPTLGIRGKGFLGQEAKLLSRSRHLADLQNRLVKFNRII